MLYRKIGKTGKKASIIGLGCENLDGAPYEQTKETIDAALEADINLLDVFMPGREIRENIAKALGDRRKDVMIQGHVGSTDIGRQYNISRDLPIVTRYFEDLLRIFGGYIDFGMMFFIDSERDFKGVFETGFADYVQKLKQQGYIGHIGFSSHSPEMAMRVIETGLPEMLMFSINLAFDLDPADKQANAGDLAAFRSVDPKRAELYALCKERGIGITVMKTLGAGRLLSPKLTPFKQPMTVAQCMHYALTRPGVASALLGCRTHAEVEEAVRYLEMSDQEKDYSAILRTLREDALGHCFYCRHCHPCPASIDIAAVHRYLDMARIDEANVPPSVCSHYAELAASGKDCTRCGRCETRCPFGVPVMRDMAEAVRIFG